MKKKITVIGIWLLAIFGILGACYGLYDLFFNDSEEGRFPNKLIYIGAILFTFIVSIGLIKRSKLSRWLSLLFGYYQVFSMIALLILAFIIGPSDDLSFNNIILIVLAILLSVFTLYILSNQEALKLFNINRKSNVKETSILAIIGASAAVLPFILSLVIMRLV